MNNNSKSYGAQWLDLLERQQRETYGLLAGISHDDLHFRDVRKMRMSKANTTSEAG